MLHPDPHYYGKPVFFLGHLKNGPTKPHGNFGDSSNFGYGRSIICRSFFLRQNWWISSVEGTCFLESAAFFRCTPGTKAQKICPFQEQLYVLGGNDGFSSLSSALSLVTTYPDVYILFTMTISSFLLVLPQTREVVFLFSMSSRYSGKMWSTKTMYSSYKLIWTHVIPLGKQWKTYWICMEGIPLTYSHPRDQLGRFGSGSVERFDPSTGRWQARPARQAESLRVSAGWSGWLIIFPSKNGYFNGKSLVKIQQLLGGLEHFSIIYIGNNPSHWRTQIFRRGWNHQPVIVVPNVPMFFEDVASSDIDPDR